MIGFTSFSEPPLATFDKYRIPVRYLGEGALSTLHAGVVGPFEDKVTSAVKKGLMPR
jgi:hypothetical protein